MQDQALANNNEYIELYQIIEKLRHYRWRKWPRTILNISRQLLTKSVLLCL